jgi:hypothetical protein
MWIEIFVSVIVLLIVAFVWRFVSRVWTSHEPIEPAGNAGILAGLHPRPTLNSGAVALDEPDDELDSDSDVCLDAARHSRPSHKSRKQEHLGT